MNTIKRPSQLTHETKMRMNNSIIITRFFPAGKEQSEKEWEGFETTVIMNNEKTGFRRRTDIYTDALWVHQAACDAIRRTVSLFTIRGENENLDSPVEVRA